MILFLDTETRSRTPIAHGVHKYSEDVEVILWQWAIDDGPVYVKDKLTEQLAAAISKADIVVMHNSSFDRTVIRHAHRIDIRPERIHDTAVIAQSHGLPAGLDKLCAIFKLGDMAKMKEGRSLIQLFCKPRPDGSWATKFTHALQWMRFEQYGGQDIVAMRELYRKLPRVNYPSPREHALWCLDQRMNDRGMAVDLDLAHAAIKTVADAKRIMDKRTQEMTDDELRSTTQRDQLLKLVLDEYGVDLPDMQKSTLERRLADPDLPDGARELLALRLQTSTTSNAKYNTLLKAVSSDGRLRGSVQFSGAARTKRWSGKIFQPQNLPRPDMAADDIALGIECIKAGAAHLIYDEPIKLCSNAIRGAIVAAPGHKLVVSDLAQVEARVLPWLAGEQWKLEAFAAYDRGEAPDNYYMAYARGFGVEVGEVTKDQRQIGKVSELSCLGPHTQVLTNHGVKSITEVTTDDWLWDGGAWVVHEGLVYQGYKPVINLSGLVVTPDHLIFAANDWREAATVASSPNTLRSALEIASASLPWQASYMAHKAGSLRLWSSALVERSRIVSSATICEKARAHAAMCAPRKLLEHGSRITTATPTSVLMSTIAGGCSDASQHASPGASPTDTLTTVAEASVSMLFGETARRAAARFSLTCSRLKVGISRVLSWIGATQTETMPQATSGSSPSKSTARADALFELCKSRSVSWSNVYDIANAGPRNRFMVLTDDGPLIVHNCGYGGAYGAWSSMGALYGFALPRAQVDEIVRAWRMAHPAICDWDTGLWKQLDDAARMAIMHPNQTFAAGEHIRFERWREWLRMELPSGGFLNYAAPAIVEDPRRPGRDTISYLGINNYSKKWERLYTYGGKLSADCTQATAREIMANSLPLIEDAGYAPILLVHDEVVTEVPDNEDYTVAVLNSLLATQPAWAPGLPLAADGFSCHRYRKG